MVRERKFVSDRVGPAEVAAMLHAFCEPDGVYPVGILESIYYDDALLSSYYEKANGDGLKRKVRIRWYPESEPKNGRRRAFLEIKDRIGSARDKVRYEFDADALLLSDASLDDPALVQLLRDTAAKAGFALPEGLAPTVSIRYHRHRFVCPVTNSRISVDYNLSCPRANPMLFPAAAPLTTPLVVCEAKSDTVWSWPFGDDLARMGFHPESFSKYGYFVEQQLQGGCFA